MLTRQGVRKIEHGMVSALLIGALLLGSTACSDVLRSPPTATPRPRIRVAGDTAMYPLIRDLLDAYQARSPDANLHLDEELRIEGLAAVRSAKAEIGLMAADAPAEAQNDSALKLTPIGLDAIVVAIHVDNPLQAISLDELRRIYAGHVTSWAELGGLASPVEVVGRAEGTDARRVIEAKVMHGSETTLEAVLAPSSEAVAEYVASHAGAIGYVSMADLAEGTKAIAVEGIQPTGSDIESGAYPLTRPLYLVTGAEPIPEVQSFLAFALGPDGQRIVARHHVRVR